MKHFIIRAICYYLLVGAIDPEKTMDLVRENQAKKDYKNQPEIVRSFEEEPNEVNEKKKLFQCLCKHRNV